MNSNHNHPVPEDWGGITFSGLVYYKAILFPFEGDASSVMTPSSSSFQNMNIFPFSLSCTVSHICHVIHFHGGKKNQNSTTKNPVLGRWSPVLHKQELFVLAEVHNSAGFSFVYLPKSHMLLRQTKPVENTVSADRRAPACQADWSQQHRALIPGQPNASLAAGISPCARSKSLHSLFPECLELN